MKSGSQLSKLAIAATAWSMIASPAFADVKAGVDAWGRGDYNAAVEQWRDPAIKGDPDAQFNMGQAYKMGRGVTADLNVALDWYKRAAAQGHFAVVDTRKTSPLNRRLERAAVVVGGGRNHRFALYDGILIKDNHIVAAGGIAAAVSRARLHAHHLLRVEVEVETLEELDQALEAGADAVLLDNMDVALLTEAVRRVRSQPGGARVIIEASGNMDATRIAAIRHLDIDVVSVGGLIHQAVWADLSMRIQQG